MRTNYFGLPVWILIAALAQPAHAAATTTHVDCSSNAVQQGQAAGTVDSPVRSLDQLNQIQFGPGSRILFKRGSTCYGSFKPRAGSSGAADLPVVVDAYGPANLPRPAIAAGCRQSKVDPDQSLTESGKTPTGISPYRSLCTYDNGPATRAAVHLYNVEHWEINALELSNDGLAEGPRVGLLVQLENFGTGKHYRINNVYVHHVHGYAADVKGPVGFKETGGILFTITRSAQAGAVPVKTRFDDVVIENSEVYHVDAIGISNRSSWMCRVHGAPCSDYLLPGEAPESLRDPANRIPLEFTPSTRFVIRNNKIHDVGGDGIIVRTATAPLVESNLIYDIWMRVAGDSAGAWSINTDNALFQYNEVHSVRKRDKMGDGMAFDSDIGTWNTVVRNNYSHNNEGGLFLYCGCNVDGLGNQGKAVGAIVENNLSVNDGYRIVTINGSELGIVRNNVIVTTKPGLPVSLIESNRYPGKNEVLFTGNQLLHGGGTGSIVRTSHRPGSLAEISWSGNAFAGYGGERDLVNDGFKRGPAPNTFAPASQQDIDAAVARWFSSSGFALRRYQPGR
jgi:hypothetical protein